MVTTALSRNRRGEITICHLLLSGAFPSFLDGGIAQFAGLSVEWKYIYKYAEFLLIHLVSFSFCACLADSNITLRGRGLCVPASLQYVDPMR